MLAPSFRQADYLAMLDQVAGQLPALQRRIVLGDRAPAGALSWGDPREAAAGASTDDLLARDELLQFDDPINIQYTSGTTGFPKGATLSHHNILNNGFFIGEGCRYTEADRVCIPVPLYHCFGMALGNLACTTHGAAIVYPSESFDPVSTLAAVERERRTSLYGSRPRLGNRLAIAPTPGHVRAGGARGRSTPTQPISWRVRLAHTIAAPPATVPGWAGPAPSRRGRPGHRRRQPQTLPPR